MIKLTEVSLNGRDDIILESPVYIPGDAVVKPWKNRYSFVTVPNASAYVVKESPEEVVRKIMDYKLLTAKHSAYYQGAAVVTDVEAEEDCLEIVSKVRINLAMLAGLEADSK